MAESETFSFEKKVVPVRNHVVPQPPLSPLSLSLRYIYLFTIGCAGMWTNHHKFGGQCVGVNSLFPP